MSDDASESLRGPSPQQILNHFPSEFLVEDGVPETQGADRSSCGIVGFAVTCCMCLEAERLRHCLSAEKICIVPVIACLLSLCLCIAGLKWVFMDKIFEYDSPNHLDPGRIGQDRNIFSDSTISSWLSSSFPRSPLTQPIRETNFQVTVQVQPSPAPSKPFLIPLPHSHTWAFTLPPSTDPSLAPTTLDVKLPERTTAHLQTPETNLQTSSKQSPAYLHSTILPRTNTRALRSSDTNTLVIPRFNQQRAGGASFPVVAPTLWNNLPPELRLEKSYWRFRKLLKTRLFC